MKLLNYKGGPSPFHSGKARLVLLIRAILWNSAKPALHLSGVWGEALGSEKGRASGHSDEKAQSFPNLKLKKLISLRSVVCSKWLTFSGITLDQIPLVLIDKKSALISHWEDQVRTSFGLSVIDGSVKIHHINGLQVASKAFILMMSVTVPRMLIVLD